MTLLENTYRQLRSAGLVDCAEAFSCDYLGKNRNWFSHQKHTGRDFSVDAAINCLSNTRHRLAKCSDSKGQRELGEVEQLLRDYLLYKHKIAEIAHQPNISESL